MISRTFILWLTVVVWSVAQVFVSTTRVEVSSRQYEPPKLVRLRGEVLDAETGRPIPSRVYVQSGDGKWFFPRSEAADVLPPAAVAEYREALRIYKEIAERAR